jgi:hypothetical protein
MPYLAKMYPAQHSKRTSRMDCAKNAKIDTKRHYLWQTQIYLDRTLAVKTVWSSGRNVSDAGDLMNYLHNQGERRMGGESKGRSNVQSPFPNK